MPGRIAAALLIVGMAPGTAAMAQDAGKADGAIKLGDQTIALTHAYAREEVLIPEMLYEGDPARRLIIVVADRELPPAASESAVLQMGMAGELHGIIIRLDPTSGGVLNGNVILGANQNPQFLSQTAGAGFYPTRDFKTAGGRVSARVSRAEPEQVMSAEGGSTQTYSFDVAFSAAVAPAPILVATAEGDAARASEPAKAFKQFLDAVVAGDAAGAQAAVAAAHPARAMLTAEGLPQLKEMLLAGAPDAVTFMAGLVKVYLYEGRAELVFEGSGGVSVMVMVREEGAWKLGD